MNIAKLSEKQALKLSEKLGVKIRKLCDKTIERADKILATCGLEAVMHINIQ